MRHQSDLFQILEDEAQGHEKKRATILAYGRAQTRFAAFLGHAKTQGEWQSRMGLIDQDLDRVVTSACVDERCLDVPTVNSAVRDQIRAKMAPCTHCDCGDCTGEGCGCCATCDGKNCYEQHSSAPLRGQKFEAVAFPPMWIPMAQKLREEGMTYAAIARQLGVTQAYLEGLGLDRCDGKNCYEQGGKSGRTAADTETGDTYTLEREELPKADLGGLSDEATVPIDKSPAGDEQHTFQKPIEVPSQRHPNEVQDIEDHADYTKALGEYSDVVKRIKAGDPMQPEFTKGPNTMVFPNKGQAQPVSARTKRADWMNDDEGNDEDMGGEFFSADDFDIPPRQDREWTADHYLAEAANSIEEALAKANPEAVDDLHKLYAMIERIRSELGEDDMPEEPDPTGYPPQGPNFPEDPMQPMSKWRVQS